MAVVWLSIGVRALSVSMKVGPAGFIIHNVKPGKLYDVFKETGLRLTIYNDSDTTHTYTLSTYRPSQRGTWETGYLEIPDATWFWFENTEVTVSPRSQGHAGLYVKIPGGDKYYNQHWVVTLGVTGKPGAGGIALAVDVRVQIETIARQEVTERPDGVIGFRPSLVRFEGVNPGGKTMTMKTVIYNNDSRAHTYTIAPLGLDNPARASRYLSASFERCPDSHWLKYAPRMVIDGGKSAGLSLELNLPDDVKLRGKKWEEILLVKPEEGLPGFIRCQVDVAKGR